jgi:ActR/RegA family two-component response regulator
MRRLAAVFCEDIASLQTLKAALEELDVDHVTCRSQQHAMELVQAGRCSTLIVDFCLSEARDVLKMAALLAPRQRPALLAMAAAWPGTGEAFQSGADRILYKPLEPVQVRAALAPIPGRRKPTRQNDLRQAPRYTTKALVYLDFETGSVPALAINLSETGFGVQATETVPMRSNLAFRCRLPGTKHTLQGCCDVIWADRTGRAGMFFSYLAPTSRKELKHWLSKHRTRKNMVRALLPPVNVRASAMGND